MWSIFSRSSFSSFPYEILEVIHENERSLWNLHKGRRKQDNKPVTIFAFDHTSKGTIELANAAHKRLKTLKHPGILKFIDSLEGEKSVYIVTEEVTPLFIWLQNIDGRENKLHTVAWGLLEITKALSFLNNDGKLSHNNVNSGSVFVTTGGEWKLFGLEYASESVDYIPCKAFSHLGVYDPPDWRKGTRVKTNIWSNDAWGFGCLVWEVFNGILENSLSLQHTSKIPKPLLPTYCDLVLANPLERPNLKGLIDALCKPGQYFNNELIQSLIFLDEIHIKDETEKQRFFRTLTSKIENIPSYIQKNKILPALVRAHEFSNDSSILIGPLFKIGQLLSENEYQNQIVPCIVRMFSSTDRATRLKLLQDMETIAEHLDPKTVNELVFQQLVTGFQDTNPTIREQTVKAILYLAPKMSYNNLNVEILKHFARLQSKDDQGGIRANTTVCLGKIAPHLHPTTRQKCLISAFTRATRDPFHPSRVAGVTAIAATQQYYYLSDVSLKILPALSMLTVDPEKSVRDIVFRVFKGFLGKLEKVSEDPSLKEIMEKEISSTSSASVDSSSSWMGWAVGALASKFYKAPSGPQPLEPQDTGLKKTTTSPLDNNITTAETTDQYSCDGRLSLEKENFKSEESISNIIGNTSEITEGWDDAGEEWGSLEVELSAEVTGINQPSKSSLSPTDDFFSTYETASKVQARNRPIPAKTDPSNNDAWDSWDDGEAKGSERGAKCTQSKVEERKQLREERKKQREADSKKTQKPGPMKLGTKKLDPLL